MNCNWMRCPLLFWLDINIHYEDWNLKAPHCPARITIKHIIKKNNNPPKEEYEYICGCLREEIE